jgi:signal transduction histidine kinase
VHNFHPEHEKFPGWVSIVYCLVPVVLAVAIAVQRDALWPPGWPAVLGALAALPWVLGLFGIRLPWLVTAPLVLGAVAVLASTADEIDISPFFLIYLTIDASMAAPMREGAATVAASLALLAYLELEQGYGWWLWMLGIVASWAGSATVGKQFELNEELRTAQAELAARAAADERQRIAREIHDVVAHSLAVTMLHLTGARMALHRDPTDAEAALLRAEQLGRQSLSEIRRTVGLLGDEPTGSTPALPNMLDIAPLVQEFASAGLDVDLEVAGDPEATATATGLCLYRITQEALANVIKHAPGAKASVRLSVLNGDAQLRVWNEQRAGQTERRDEHGRGITGMKERAALLGGTLHAGPCAGGWTVEANLPREMASA